MFALLQPASASAEWLIWPYIGLKFAGSTTLPDLEQAADNTNLTIGGSITILGEGILGVEGDVGYSPRFFERETEQIIIASSSVSTVTGNVIVAVPRSVTRESLRPYALGGIGLMHVGIDDVLDFAPDRNFLCLSIGAGAIGAVTQRTSIRFELRHFRNLTTEDEESVSFGRTRLSFWRATVGVTLRY